MTEPRQLVEARQRLSRAESGIRTCEGRFHLEEGLALLEKVVFDGRRRRYERNVFPR